MSENDLSSLTGGKLVMSTNEVPINLEDVIVPCLVPLGQVIEISDEEHGRVPGAPNAALSTAVAVANPLEPTQTLPCIESA